MTFRLLMATFNIPRGIQRKIQEYIIEKGLFNNVLREIDVRYNSGLWWLYHIPVTEMFDCYGEYIENADKVTFTTLNQDEDISYQAILHDRILDEIKYGVNLMFGY